MFLHILEFFVLKTQGLRFNSNPIAFLIAYLLLCLDIDNTI